jgi:hypothetical protein
MTYIIGYPNETTESMLGTLDQVRRIRAHCPLSHPAVWPYRPIPGTPMYREALALGYRPPTTLLGWGTVGEYHLDDTWPGKIPPHVLRRRELFQHFATLSHGIARGKTGWWEKRAMKRLRDDDFRFARIEAKAFDVYHSLASTLTGKIDDTVQSWESGDGAYAEKNVTPRRRWSVEARRKDAASQEQADASGRAQTEAVSRSGASISSRAEANTSSPGQAKGSSSARIGTRKTRT